MAITGSRDQSGPNSHALNSGDTIVRALRQHAVLCQEILTVVERENRALHSPAPYAADEFTAARKNLLPRLQESLAQLKEARVAWSALSIEERRGNAEGASLLRLNQDIIMKIILLDRDNEQSLLRHGLVPQAHVPPAQRQRPHFVTDLYRNSSGK